MLAIEVSVNIFLLAGIILICLAGGFLFRSEQIRKLRKKVVELETEMLNNHADILQLQKDKALMEQKMKESKIPVIPLNKTKSDTDGSQEAMK